MISHIQCQSKSWTIKIMNVSDCLRNIYIGAFSEYLSVSNSLGGLIKEQSSLVNCLLKLEMNLIQILQKYRKPVHYHKENIFLEPIAKQIKIIKTFTTEKINTCRYLQLISDGIDIFCWMEEPDLEIFVSRFSDCIIAYKDQYRDSNFGVRFSKWLEAWTQVLEEFSELILNYYKNGLVWQGCEDLPTQAVLGDKNGYRNFDHAALFKEINQGENISSVLRHRNEDTGTSTSQEH